MGKILTIARKEVSWYFNTPVGYVLLGLFGALANFLAVRDLFLRGQADLSALFFLIPWLILVFIAAVSMRAISEEKKSGTFEVLLALPVSEGKIILGKFLGLGIFALLGLTTTLPSAAVAVALGRPDLGVIAAGYLAAFLLSLALLSVGIFISALSENQAAAVFTSLVVFFLVMVIGSLLITDQVPRFARSAFFFISPMARYESIARGVLDLRDIFYFLSVIFGFVYLSMEILRRNR